MARNLEVINASHAIQGILLSMSIFAHYNMLNTGKIPIQNEYLKIVQKAYSLVSTVLHVNSSRPMPGKVNIMFSEETFHLMDIWLIISLHTLCRDLLELKSLMVWSNSNLRWGSTSYIWFQPCWEQWSNGGYMNPPERRALSLSRQYLFLSSAAKSGRSYSHFEI